MTETARTGPQRLSVPPRLKQLPRPLTDEEQASLVAIADVLVPGTDRDPAPSATTGYPDALVRSLIARTDAFDAILAVARRLAGADAVAIDAELRRLHAEDPDTFQPLSAVLAGAYFQVQEVLDRLAYPGQKKSPPPMEQIVDELETGILDPVIGRGPIYTRTGEE